MPDDLTDDLPNDSARSTDTSDSNQANAEVGEMNEDAPPGSGAGPPRRRSSTRPRATPTATGGPSAST